MPHDKLKLIVESALLVAGRPLSINQLLDMFDESERPEVADIREAIAALREDYQSRSLEIKELASGFCVQVRQEFSIWISKLSEERAPRYSRALLETLAIIAYRQPITRAEIEAIRGVAVSTHIVKTLMDREWIRSVGHRDVPGKPELLATTRQFLDHFNLKALVELPPLTDIQSMSDKLASLESLDLLPSNDSEVNENDESNESLKVNSVSITQSTEVVE
jgi:segregation and condensation protein B